MKEAEARQLLAVEPTASRSEVRSAYRAMLKRWHPDLLPSDSPSYPEAIRQTQRINAAYWVLERDTRKQEVASVLDQARPLVGWNGRLVRTSLGRFELLTLVAVAVLLAVSGLIENWIRSH